VREATGSALQGHLVELPGKYILRGWLRWMGILSAFLPALPGALPQPRQSASSAAFAARPPGALWRLSGAAQSAAGGAHPDAPPARGGRGEDRHRSAALEVGAAAEARVCTRDGALPVLSAGGAAAHRRPHAGRGDPADPPASATRHGSTCRCPSACPPGSLRVVLRLPTPRVSPPPARAPGLGGAQPPSSGPA
jgi:hypothetical protein